MAEDSNHVFSAKVTGTRIVTKQIDGVPTQIKYITTNLDDNQPITAASKRVSFDEQQVKTFVYDTDPNDEYFDLLQSKQPFTDPGAPASRITVVAEESEMPTTIMPPSQIEEAYSGAASPRLPALFQKREGEIENPFRPEEILFHEVDPIVEAYRNKPYPPSLPGSPCASPVKSINQAYLNGISPSSLVADKDMDKFVSDTTPLTSPVLADDDPDMLKAQQVECVRIEKKKCGCCTVQ